MFSIGGWGFVIVVRVPVTSPVITDYIACCPVSYLANAKLWLALVDGPTQMNRRNSQRVIGYGVFIPPTLRSNVQSQNLLTLISTLMKVIQVGWRVVDPVIYACDMFPKFENLLPWHEFTETNDRD